jgi:outer membrane usher protein
MRHAPADIAARRLATVALRMAFVALTAVPCATAMAFWQAPTMNASTDATQDRIAGEPVMLELFVNDVRRNEILALIDTDAASATGEHPTIASGLWVSARDFDALGIAVGNVPRADAGGETYLRLTTSTQLAIALDLDALRLSLKFAPDLLGHQVIDLSTVSDLPAGQALPAHAWLDYDLDLRADRQRWLAAADFALNAAFAGWTLRSEHAIVAGAGGTESGRVRSFAERDWPRAMVRVSLGELPASRMPFGRLGPMTGLRIARRFDLRPGFGPSPTFSYDGTVDSPATAEIYLDDALLRTVPIEPGRYDLRNLAYFSGLRDVRIVVSDAFGGRREILMPHYFSDGPLKRGIHEFEYTLSPAHGDAGAQRGPALTAWHRYGIDDRLTVGGGIEATRDTRVLSADFAAVLGRVGTLQGQYARVVGSGSAGEGASAMTLRYGFVVNALSFSLGEWRMDPAFQRREDASMPTSPLVALTSADLSFSLPGRQSISLSAACERRERAEDTTRFALRYAVRPTGRMSLSARLARSRTAGRDANEAMLSMQFDFGAGWSGGMELERRAGRDRRALAIERGSPQAGGWGLRARIEDDQGNRRLEAVARRDFAIGEFGALLRQRQGDAAGAMAGLQFGGALIAAGGRLHATRPVREGFALVDTGGLADVRVYRNNTLAGRTGADGRLLLPGLGAYTRQQIRLDDRDVPIEVALDAIAIDTVARSRIGIDVRFPSRRIVGAGGRLMFPAEGGSIPVASAVLTTTVEGKPVRTSTAPDGEFYFDGLVPGEFTLEARNATLSCRANMRIDASAPAFTDLGEVACAPIH